MPTLPDRFLGRIHGRFDALFADADFFVATREGRLTRARVLRYVENVQHLVRRTEAHLALAVAASVEQRLDDLAAFFRGRADEEQGHAAWGDADVARLSDGAASATSPTPDILALAEEVGTLAATDPARYLVYVAFVEALTPHAFPRWFAELRDRGPVTRDELTLLDSHATLDEAHAAEDLALLDATCAGPSAADEALALLDHFLDRYEGFVRGI